MHGRNGVKRYVFVRYVGHCESQCETGTGMTDWDHEPGKIRRFQIGPL